MSVEYTKQFSIGYARGIKTGIDVIKECKDTLDQFTIPELRKAFIRDRSRFIEYKNRFISGSVEYVEEIEFLIHANEKKRSDFYYGVDCGINYAVEHNQMLEQVYA